MEKERGFRILAIVAICLAVAGLTLGYAALSQTLTINTTAVVKAQTWEVKFENLGTPTVTGNGSSTSATLAATQIDVAANVNKPGDSVTYTFDVTNSGTLDAKLDSAPTITGTASTDMVSYTLTYSDTSVISANDTLAAGATAHLVLTVKYKDTVTTPPTTDTTYNISATLLYVQD